MTNGMINAKPQINGNSRSDFEAAYKALTQAIAAIGEANSLLDQNVLHGRNYQHLQDGLMARETDMSEVAEEMIGAIKAVGNVRRDLAQAIK